MTAHTGVLEPSRGANGDPGSAYRSQIPLLLKKRYGSVHFPHLTVSLESPLAVYGYPEQLLSCRVMWCIRGLTPTHVHLLPLSANMLI
jgi:hypothetical protein